MHGIAERGHPSVPHRQEDVLPLERVQDGARGEHRAADVTHAGPDDSDAPLA
jgi:hypothetical protein